MAYPQPYKTFIEYNAYYYKIGTQETYFNVHDKIGTSIVYDNLQDGNSDSATQVGDVGYDNYHFVDFDAAGTPGAQGTGIFIGSTSGQHSFIGRDPNGSYHLYTSAPGNYANTTVGVLPGGIGNGVSLLACYAAGTNIRIARSNEIQDVAVEDLVVGDLAVTASGAHRPIRWLGHRAVDCREHPRAPEVHPVRIAAHAFGTNRPARDLLVSPGHAICVDIVGEVLVPAVALVNGSTVRQVEVDAVTYWHVELDSHDILLAENLPAESYLEMDNRGFFAEMGIVDLHAGPDAAPAQRTHADFCRPFHDVGQLVDVVRTQLSARAEQLGWRLDRGSPFADLHLVADGARIEPVTRGLSARFTVPAGARDVSLASSSARAYDVGAGADRRDLGVWLAGLTIEDGFECRTIALNDPLLCAGFHVLEANGNRWTAGRAMLPVALWDGHDAGGYLRVDLAGPALPRWIAPSRDEAADRIVTA